jgi:hypothetical protein
VDDNTNPSCSTNTKTSTAAPTTSGINDSSPTRSFVDFWSR